MMHRSQGGNARKKKAKLTDEMFLSVVGSRGLSSTTEGRDESTTTVLDPLDLANRTGLHHVMGSALDTTSAFAGARFVLGTTHCPSCQHELIYYQDQEVLQRGFSFRCRVCQTLATVEQSPS